MAHCDATKFGCGSSAYILTFTTTSIAQVSHNTKLIVCFTDIFKPKYIGECKLQFLNTNYGFTGTYTIDRREGEDRWTQMNEGSREGRVGVRTAATAAATTTATLVPAMANKHANSG